MSKVQEEQRTFATTIQVRKEYCGDDEKNSEARNDEEYQGCFLFRDKNSKKPFAL